MLQEKLEIMFKNTLISVYADFHSAYFMAQNSSSVKKSEILNMLTLVYSIS